ncbi:MAG: tetratricopeptide repeat protein, partial [Deltaproteobacteria bacterium]|nr:tetratricopeptide repeat protein [Deltaproteobacteria bacterium]
VRRARDLAERSIRTEALRQHDMAQEHNEARRFAQAVALYEVYLRHFPRSARSYDIRYFAAEIYFHRMRRYEEAGQFYLAAVDQNRRGRYTRDALYNAISALELVREAMLERCGRRRAEPQPPRETAPTPTPGPAAPATPGTPATPPSGGATPGGAGAAQPAAGGQPARQPECPTQGEGGYQETENDRRFTRAIELYVELFPNDPDLPEILFRQGNLYYDRGIFDPAVRMFGQLLERFPQSRFAQRAGELILESFNRAQDYGNIERWARRLKQSPAFQNPDSQRRLDALIVQAVFKQGEQLAARGEHAEAAAAYLRAAEEFPRDGRAPQAVYNAGQEHQRAGDPEAAAEAYDQLLERYPSSNEAQLGVWSAAQMFESLAQLRDAARYYDTYGRRFPQGQHGPDALYNAVLLRVTVGDDEAASDSGQAFLRQFPQHQSVDDVYFLMGRAHEQGERWQQAADLYRQYIDRTRNTDRKIEAMTRLGQVLMRMSNQRGARETLERAVALGRRHSAELRNEGRYHAAHARYLQGEMVLAEYGDVRIAGDISGLRQSLQRKSEMLQRAATIYLDVVTFNVAEWATAALYRIGQVYEQFAEAIRNAPVPTELNEEEQNVYREELEGFVIPIEERALEAYEEGYRRAIQLRIYNRWTQRMREALTRLNDSLYPALREVGADTRTGEPRIVLRPLDGLRRDTAAIRGRTEEATAETASGAARPESRARGRRDRGRRDRGRDRQTPSGGDRSGRRGGR